MVTDTCGMKTLELLRGLCQEGIETYAVLMRHSARHHDTAENDLSLGLTEEGRRAAYEFGRALPSDSFLQFFSSPVLRCVETSELIDRGCLSNGGRTKHNGAVDPLSGFFARNGPAVLQMAHDMAKAGRFPEFFRNWFDGRLPSSLIQDSRQASRALVHYLLGLIQGSGEKGSICITHDWHLVLLREYGLGQRPEEYGGHIEYLEGVILFVRGSNYYIVNHQREAKILRFP
jgi:broad specificity phosphatase PhoE